LRCCRGAGWLTHRQLGTTREGQDKQHRLRSFGFSLGGVDGLRPGLSVG